MTLKVIDKEDIAHNDIVLSVTEDIPPLSLRTQGDLQVIVPVDRILVTAGRMFKDADRELWIQIALPNADIHIRNSLSQRSKGLYLEFTVLVK